MKAVTVVVVLAMYAAFISFSKVRERERERVNGPRRNAAGWVSLSLSC